MRAFLSLHRSIGKLVPVTMSVMGLLNFWFHVASLDGPLAISRDGGKLLVIVSE